MSGIAGIVDIEGGPVEPEALNRLVRGVSYPGGAPWQARSFGSVACVRSHPMVSDALDDLSILDFLMVGHNLRPDDGGVTTYLPSQFGVQSAQGLPRSYAGWCQAHAEVTAAAGSVPGFGASSASWLRRTQQTDGSWSSYWYGDDAFATALAAEHLAQHSGVAHRVPIECAVAWAAGKRWLSALSRACSPRKWSTDLGRAQRPFSFRRLVPCILWRFRAETGFPGTGKASSPLRRCSMPYRGLRRLAADDRSDVAVSAPNRRRRICQSMRKACCSSFSPNR